ncbi:hypothetical protein PIROE2DRAFT_1918 [Piromyces sp. E2]|nr:hypothetical protein PIROE2DRAFT_1918 [Piromyces sp. E2]|eukprot:OUM69981.1 hypothetical protein PIROE2DRAFT_1918 [Piromyces sp. E2]
MQDLSILETFDDNTLEIDTSYRRKHFRDSGSDSESESEYVRGRKVRTINDSDSDSNSHSISDCKNKNSCNKNDCNNNNSVAKPTNYYISNRDCVLDNFCNCLIIQNSFSNDNISDKPNDNNFSSPPCYFDYIEVFDEKHCENLPLHFQYDYEIRLKDNSILFYGPIYPLIERERDEL